MLQEVGNPESWSLKDRCICDYADGWSVVLCTQEGAKNMRCSVGLLVKKSIGIDSWSIFTSASTGRPLVIAACGRGWFGSFHGSASNQSLDDWKRIIKASIKGVDQGWWLVGGDFNDDLLEATSVEEAKDGEDIVDIASFGGITQKSGNSIDGFKHFGTGVKQFGSLFRMGSDEASGSRFSFVSDHTAICGTFIVDIE